MPATHALKERAYLDVVRVYRPGDRVFVVGFSRGAAIARLLAAVLSRRGAPRSLWTFRAFGRMLPVWKSSSKTRDRVPVKVLGCWDTVGAFGISKDVMGIKFQKINLLKDLTVAEDVERAYHMVALDETRDSFEPTLMDTDPTNDTRIVEVWFSGNHANVGGGFSTDGLSDVTLDFFLQHVSSGWATEPIGAGGARRRGKPTGDESWGLYLRGDEMREIEPDPMGKLRQSTGPMYTHRPRRVSLGAIISDFVFARMQNPELKYARQSLFNLIKEFVDEREKIGQALENLKQTGALDDEESNKVREWLARYTPSRWSESPLSKRLNPKDELANPFFLEPEAGPEASLPVARPT